MIQWPGQNRKHAQDENSCCLLTRPFNLDEDASSKGSGFGQRENEVEVTHAFPVHIFSRTPEKPGEKGF